MVSRPYAWISPVRAPSTTDAASATRNTFKSAGGRIAFRGKKYKVYMEAYNYLPLWLCDFIMKSGLWWVIGKINLFRLFRFVYGLGLKPDAEE